VIATKEAANTLASTGRGGGVTSTGLIGGTLIIDGLVPPVSAF
jgi:hypothetical protein